MCLPLEDDPPGEHDKISIARDPSGGLPTVSEHQVPTSVVPVVERLLQVNVVPARRTSVSRAHFTAQMECGCLSFFLSSMCPMQKLLWPFAGSKHELQL